jgi:transglutaminase-like putative cysteine protease
LAALWLGPASGRAQAGAAPGAPVYDAANPPAGIFDDEWSEMKIGGQKAGYLHQVFQRQGDEIVTDTRMVLKIARLGNVVGVTEDAHTEETLAGVPRAFKTTTLLASQPVVAEGSGDGRVFQVTLQSGAYRDAHEVRLPEGTVMTWGAERRERQEGLKPGTKFTVWVYSPEDELLKPLSMSVAVGAKEAVSVHGANANATRVEETTETAAGAVRAVTWVNDDYNVVKMELPMGGFTAELTPVTQAEALSEYLPGDIFTASLIEVPVLPENATAVTYKLQRRDGQALTRPPDSATETSVTDAGGATLITLAKDGGTAGPGNLTAAQLAPYLERNSFLDTSDPLVKKLAAQAGGPDGAAPKALAQRLRDFVAAYIQKKDLSVGFATATEVARTREGDCTEHAVLLAALGRARGLPTRVVAGLAYVPDYAGKPAILGYHMWAQFYIDGQWRDYDAALPELAGAPRRLGLVASDLNEESLADFSLGLLDWMAQLEVSVAK